MRRQIELSENEKLEAREWRLERCGSASFKVLFEEFLRCIYFEKSLKKDGMDKKSK